MLEVLLIDDDEKLGPLLTEYCERYGIGITAATLPSIGLERLRRDDFDAVILDVMLPEMDGFELVRRIRYGTVPQYKDVPILMLTGQDTEDNVQKGRFHKINGFIITFR